MNRLQPERPESLVDWLVSGLVALVAIGGIAAVGTAALLFFPGSNESDGTGSVSTPTNSVEVPAVGDTDDAEADPVTTVTEADPVTTVTEAPLAVVTTTSAPVTTQPPDGTEPADRVEDVAVDVAGTRLIAYRVVRGDTLAAIGRGYGVDWRELAALNELPDPDVIGIGQVLQIPVTDAIGGVQAQIEADADLRAIDGLFDERAVVHGVPAELLKAVAWASTRWGTQEGLREGIGIGSMSEQALDAATSELDATLDPSDPADAIEAMAIYLGLLLETTEGDTLAALAAYETGVVSPRDIVWSDRTVEFISAVLDVRPVFEG